MDTKVLIKLRSRGVSISLSRVLRYNACNFLFALGAGFLGRRGSLDFEEDLGFWTRIFESSLLMRALLFWVHLGSIYAMLLKFQHPSEGQIGSAWKMWGSEIGTSGKWGRSPEILVLFIRLPLHPAFPGFWNLNKTFCFRLPERLSLIRWYNGFGKNIISDKVDLWIYAVWVLFTTEFGTCYFTAEYSACRGEWLLDHL